MQFNKTTDFGIERMIRSRIRLNKNTKLVY